MTGGGNLNRARTGGTIGFAPRLGGLLETLVSLARRAVITVITVIRAPRRERLRHGRGLTTAVSVSEIVQATGSFGARLVQTITEVPSKVWHTKRTFFPPFHIAVLRIRCARGRHLIIIPSRSPGMYNAWFRQPSRHTKIIMTTTNLCTAWKKSIKSPPAS